MTAILLILLVLLLPLSFGTMIYFSHEGRSSKHDDEWDKAIDDPSRVVELAEKYEDENDYQSAVEAWSRYQELRSDDTSGYFRRGINLQHQGKHERALEDFKQVSSMEGNPPELISYYRARSQAALGREEQALSSFVDHLKATPEKFSLWKKVADWATRRGYFVKARELWNHLKETAEPPLRDRAMLNLAEIDLENDQIDRARDKLDELEPDRLSDFHENHFTYLRGLLLDREGRENEAEACFREIHKNNSEYRDVDERLESAGSERNTLVEKYSELPPNEFVEFCRNIVDEAGYEIIDLEVQNGDEVTVECRDSGGGNISDLDHVLIAFKRWDNQAGQMSVKDFEMNLLEGGYDLGYFVSPGGFKNSARELSEGNPNLVLTTPETVRESLSSSGSKIASSTEATVG